MIISLVKNNLPSGESFVVLFRRVILRPKAREGWTLYGVLLLFPLAINLLIITVVLITGRCSCILAISGCILTVTGCVLAVTGRILAISGRVLAVTGCILTISGRCRRVTGRSWHVTGWTWPVYGLVELWDVWRQICRVLCCVGRVCCVRTICCVLETAVRRFKSKQREQGINLPFYLKRIFIYIWVIK